MADTTADTFNALNGPNLDWIGTGGLSGLNIPRYALVADVEQLCTDDTFRIAVNGRAARLGAQGEGLTCSPLS